MLQCLPPLPKGGLLRPVGIAHWVIIHPGQSLWGIAGVGPHRQPYAVMQHMGRRHHALATFRESSRHTGQGRLPDADREPSCRMNDNGIADTLYPFTSGLGIGGSSVTYA